MKMPHVIQPVRNHLVRLAVMACAVMLELAQPYDKLGQVGADNDKLLLTIQHWVLAAATGNDFAIPGLHLP
jgi:hypothetical protein